MNNEEKILKYFSDDLSPEEKRNIEKEIEISKELKSEFEKMQNILTSLKNESDFEVENQYFINLMPNIRNRMHKKKQFFTSPKLAYLLPLIAIVLVFTFTINKNYNSEISFSLDSHNELINEVLDQASVNQLSDYMDLGFNGGETDFSVLNDELELNTNNLISVGENTLKSFDEYELINELSEEEAGEIYNKLLQTKFL